MMYHHSKFGFSSFSRLGCVFFEILRLLAIMNTRWRLFQNVGIFPLATLMPNLMFLAYSKHPKQYDEWLSESVSVKYAISGVHDSNMLHATNMKFCTPCTYLPYLLNFESSYSYISYLLSYGFSKSSISP